MESGEFGCEYIISSATTADECEQWWAYNKWHNHRSWLREKVAMSWLSRGVVGGFQCGRYPYKVELDQCPDGQILASHFAEEQGSRGAWTETEADANAVAGCGHVHGHGRGCGIHVNIREFEIKSRKTARVGRTGRNRNRRN